MNIAVTHEQTGNISAENEQYIAQNYSGRYNEFRNRRQRKRVPTSDKLTTTYFDILAQLKPISQTRIPKI